MNTPATYFEAYILELDPMIQERMRRVRETILQACPEAAEGDAYRMPSFAYRGKPLVYIAAAKKHIGVYPTADDVDAEIPELASYRAGKGTLQFPHRQELPLELISRLVQVRKAHIDAARR